MHAPESERYVAASIISGSFSEVLAEGVGSDDFAEPGPYAVCTVAEELLSRGKEVNPDSIRHLLRQKDVWGDLGGQKWWSDLVSAAADSASLDLHVEEVKAASRVRRSAEVAEKIQKAARGGSAPQEAANKISSFTSDLLEAQSEEGSQVRSGEDFGEAAQEILSSDVEMTVKTGFTSYDEWFGGLIHGRINVVAARTDHGKTAFSDQILLNVARRYRDETENKTVVKFDLENGPLAAQMRLLSNLSGVPISKIRAHVESNRDLSQEAIGKIKDAASELSELPFVLDTTPGADTTHVHSRLLGVESEREVGLVVVDYLTLMGEEGNGAMEKTMSAVTGLHNLAGHMDIPVLAVSQINREPMGSSDPIPQLHHMAWSDDVAQKPAQVAVLHHPLTHWQQTSASNSRKPDPMEYKVALRKNKGPKGKMLLKFNKDCLRFEDESDGMPF